MGPSPGGAPSPPSFVFASEPDRERVQREENCEEDDDPGCGERPELLLGPGDPLVDLHREGGEVAQDRRVERDVRERSDEQERRRLAESSGEREDRARRDPRDRRRQYLPPDDLPLRGAKRVGTLADRVRNSPNRLAGRNDHRWENEQRQDHPAREQDPPEADSAYEERKAEDPVDDRGHRREVLDVDLEHPVVPAVPVRVLLEVDGRSDAQRHGKGDDDDPEIDRREDRRTSARDQRVGRRRLEEEDGVDPLVTLEEDLREQRPKREKADGQRGHQEAEEDAPGP